MEPSLDILIPVGLMFGLLVAFVYLLGHRGGESAIFELGTVFAGVVVLYASYPMITYVLNDLSFPYDADYRIVTIIRPTLDEMASMAWFQCLFLAAFTTTYALVRGRIAPRPVMFNKPDAALVAAAAILLVLLTAFAWAVDGGYELTVTGDYLEEYTSVQRLPLVVRQVFTHLAASIFPLKILLMIRLMMDFRESRTARWIVVGWTAYEVAHVAVTLHARTNLFLFIALAAACFHYLVRRIPVRAMFVGAGTVLALFLVLGSLRTAKSSGIENTGFSNNNEFEALLGNALDVRRLRALGHGGEVQVDLYLGDFLRPIPQQILPVSKTALSQWYLQTFYPEFGARGGGFAFGVVAESMLGTGWPDLILRGSVLGVLFALLHRHLVGSVFSFYRFAFYIWLTAVSFASFRESTLVFLTAALYQIVPVFAACHVLSTVIRGLMGSGHPPTLLAAKTSRRPPLAAPERRS